MLMWIPARAADRLHVRAGGAGHLLAMSDDLLATTMGIGSEAIMLGQLADRMLMSPVTSAVVLADLHRSFAAIEREYMSAQSGSETSVSAHILRILVALWRMSGIEASAGRPRGAASAILQRYRHLVELHFRDHWPIPRYAKSLAVSADRLHAICTRELARSPLRLVHERVAREAVLLLSRSVLTVEQISNHLGFKDPAHFNRFFKIHVGTPPGAFRRNAGRTAVIENGPAPYSYADWP